MGRPPLPIGTHGNIRTRPVPGGTEARCRFRAADGSIRRLRRVRATPTAATNAVKAAVVELADEIRGGDISPASRLRAVAEAWYGDFALQVAEGRKSPKTAEIYRSYLDVHILPAMGDLRMREVNTVKCQALMTAKRKAKARDDKLAGIRNVLSLVCSYATQHGALKVNPVRELQQLQRTARKEVRALDAEQRKDLLGKLEADEKARQFDLADVLRGMLATGVRVSELLGCCGDDVLLDELDGRPRLVVAHRTTRIKGEGVVRRKRTGGSKGAAQKLLIPAWSVPLFRARKLASGGAGPLFPNAWGQWRSNDSVTNPLRDALDRAGYEWVTSHVMRKTVGTVLDEAGLPVRKVADQLGQRSTAVTERHYIESKASNDAQVEVLERMMG